MPGLTPLIVASLLVLSGLASQDQMHYVAGSGDAGQFILLQAVARAGHPWHSVEAIEC